MEMKYENIEIGKIYKLKDNANVWSVELQNNVIFPNKKVYVEVTHKAFNNVTLFGNLIESNPCEAVRRTELEFGVNDIDENSEVFDNADTFKEKNTIAIYLDYGLDEKK